MNVEKVKEHFRLNIILALSKNSVIGNNNGLPWKFIPADMNRFKKLTIGSTVLMGRKTWDSLPNRFKPLPKRTNLVLSRNDLLHMGDGVHVVSNSDSICRFGDIELRPDLFVIGGSELFNIFGEHADNVYITMINKDYDGDTFINAKILSIWNNRGRITHQRFFPSNNGTPSFEFIDLVM